MNDDDILKKLAEARQAMGAGKLKAKKEKENILLDHKRLEAKIAMEGKTHKDKRELTEAEMKEKRERAKQAMETMEQKETREREERKKREKEIAEKKLADLREEKRKRDLLSEKQKEAGVADKYREKVESQEEYLQRLKRTNEQIEKITTSPELDVTPIHTLKTDTGKTVRDSSLSVADIAIKERKKNNYSERKEYKKSNSLILLITIGLLTIIGSGSIYTAWWFVSQNQTRTLEIIPIVSTQNNTEIEITNKTTREIRSELETILNQPEIPDTINNIYFTNQTEEGKQLLEINNLLLTLGVVLPVDFTHFLTNRYMFGVHYGTDPSPFFIFSTRSFANTFDALLKNEREVAGNLLRLFGLNLPGDSFFVDRIIQNVDTRLIETSEGEVVALYAFLDPQTLVITTKPATLMKIMSLNRSTPAR